MAAGKNELEFILKFKNEAAKVLKQSKAQLKGLGDGAGKATVKVKGLSSGLVDLAGGASLAFAAFNQIKNVTSKFGEAEVGLINLSTLLSDDVMPRMAEFESALTNMALTSGESFGSLTDGLYQAVSAFGALENITDVTRIAMESAVAGLATTEQALNAISAVTRGYGKTSTAAVEAVSDLLFTTVRLGQTTFPELASAIGVTIPLANTLGISFREVSALMATFAGVTGSTTEVATQMRGLFQSFVKPMEDFAKLNKKLSITTEDWKDTISKKGVVGALNDLKRLAEENGFQFVRMISRVEALNLALAATGGGAENLARNFRLLGDATGARAKAFEKQLAAMNRAIARAREGFAVLQRLMGEQLAPIIISVADAITAAAQVLASSDKRVQAFTARIALLVTTLVGLKGVSLLLRLAFGRSLTSLLATAGAGVLTFTKHLLDVPGAFAKVRAAFLLTRTAILTSAGLPLVGVVVAIGLVTAAFRSMDITWAEVINNAINNAVFFGRSLKEKLSGPLDKITELWEGLTKAITDASEALGLFAPGLVGAPSQPLQDLGDKLLKFITSAPPLVGVDFSQVIKAWKSARDAILDTDEAMKKVKATTEEARQELADKGIVLGKFVGPLLPSDQEIATTIQNGFVDYVKAAEDKGGDVASSFVSSFKTVLMAAFGLTDSEFKTLFGVFESDAERAAREAAVAAEIARRRNLDPNDLLTASQVKDVVGSGGITSIQDTVTAGPSAAEVQQELQSQAAIDSSEKFRSAMKEALDGIEEDFGNWQDKVGTLVIDTFNGMSEALSDFVVDGKADFKGLIKDMIKQMIKLAIQQKILGVLAGSFGGLFGGASTGELAGNGQIGAAGGFNFDAGGVVPGPTGRPVRATVHAGEGVFTPEQMGNADKIVRQLVAVKSSASEKVGKVLKSAVIGGKFFTPENMAKAALPGKIQDAANGVSSSVQEVQKLISNDNVTHIRRLIKDQEDSNNRPSFATGGIVKGRVGDPVTANIHGGEGVFTPRQMDNTSELIKALAQSSKQQKGGSTTVNVINNASGASAKATESTDSQGNIKIDVLVEAIENKLTESIHSGGSLARSMEGQYGLDRAQGSQR